MLKRNKKFVWIVILVLIFIIIGVFFVVSNNGVEEQTAAVTRGDIPQLVSVTGTLKPVDDVELSFNRSGKVAEVLVDVGDNVNRGQTVVRLDNRDAAISLEEARVAYQKIINVDDLDVVTAENNIKDFEENLDSSYNKARAVLISRTKDSGDIVDGIYDLLSTNAYLKSLNLNSSSLAQSRLDTAESAYYKAKKELHDFLKVYQVSDLSENNQLIEDTLDEFYGIAILVSQAAKQTKDAITYTRDRDFGLASEADIAHARVSALATTANDSLNSLLSVKNDISSYKRSVVQAKIKLVDVVDGPDATDVRASKLAIEQKEKDYSDYFLTSPIVGVVTRQDAKVGEQVSSGVAIVSVISADNLEIEANVPEVDIGRVAVGYDVDVTFDAFPAEKFTGKVTMVDPAQTVIDGVVNFKVTIALSVVGERLRSGLTANVEIKSTLAQDVLLVPRAAVIERDGSHFVNIIDGKKIIERQIKTGVFGQIGSVEILGGLTEGEVVLIR